jgi:murein DD-endopeptidase MepM/ murein hydrolase activator NlpD
MKLTPPFPLSTISQGFGANAVSAYSNMGLKGHPGIDFGVDWGTPINCAVDSLCYSTMNKNNPNLMGYRAVFTIVDDVDCSWEVSYGHCNDIYLSAPKNVTTGQILASVGNTGDVYLGGNPVTNAEKLAGSRAGAHLHFQVRKLKKVPVNEFDVTKHHVNDGNGLLSLNGFNYQVPEWDNGFNGCVDPQQFFGPTPYDKLIALGNEMMATNPVQARIVLAVAGVVKAFS